MTIVVRADRNDRFVTVNLDGILIDVENEHPDIEFEVYLGGKCTLFGSNCHQILLG